MRKVRHRNVVQFIGACTRQPNLCILVEYMAGGSVYDFMRRRGLFPVPKVAEIGHMVAKGALVKWLWPFAVLAGKLSRNAEDMLVSLCLCVGAFHWTTTVPALCEKAHGCKPVLQALPDCMPGTNRTGNLRACRHAVPASAGHHPSRPEGRQPPPRREHAGAPPATAPSACRLHSVHGCTRAQPLSLMGGAAHCLGTDRSRVQAPETQHSAQCTYI